MKEHKSFLTYFTQAVEQYRADRLTSQPPDANTATPTRTHRILRWLIPNGGTILLALILILTQNVWAKPLQSALNTPGPSATTINYQGRLADSSGNPKDGTFGMTFAFYESDTSGSPVWGPESHAAVPVSDGLFSVGLGSQTSGGIPTSVWNGDRYLEITVGGETLAPRELIRSVPVAGMALTVPDGAIGTEQIADGSVINAQWVVIGPGSDDATTTSTIFENIPGYEIQVTTSGGPVMLFFQSNVRGDDTGDAIVIDFTIDDVRVGQGSHGINRIVNSSARTEVATTVWIAHPPAGMHTFRVQWRVDADNGTEALINQGAFSNQFAVIELKK